MKEQIIAALKAHDFLQAAQLAAQVPRSRMMPANMGDALLMLNLIYEYVPAILAPVEDPAQLEDLRLVAAMMYLYGQAKNMGYYPLNFQTSLPFSNEVAARMFLTFARHQGHLHRYDQFALPGVVPQVKYADAGETSCQACQAMKGKIFTIHDAPELPYHLCTSPNGCRCDYLPVIPSLK